MNEPFSRSTFSLLFAALFLIAATLSFEGATGGSSIVGLPMGPGLRMEPYFAEEDNLRGDTSAHLIRNVSVVTGATAFLECRVRNLGAKRVSWVRHRDVHILAVGGVAFASDRRMSARAFEDTGRFVFTIKETRKSDEGAYECQISTEPPRALVINLFVQGEFFGLLLLQAGKLK